MEWTKLSGEKIETSIIDEVEQVIIRETEAGNSLKVCIGTDSQVYNNITQYATVIVFVRKKRGGFMYINQDKTNKTISIKERMLTEVAKSIAIAYEICALLDLYQVEMEVHADINTNPQFKSNLALSEAMGYIKGMGFKFKAKPDAFASSYCANKIVH
jgi:predicted RNase H-related nuclease YkuK (DUF458 family)